MSDSDTLRRLDAVKVYLRENSTRSQLVTLRAAYFDGTITSSDTTKLATVLTSMNFGASGGSAALTGLHALDVVSVCNELIAEMDRAGVTSWTTAQSAEYDGRPAVTWVSWADAEMVN